MGLSGLYIYINFIQLCKPFCL